jgi:PIN domain nuclease of toxin-antitoxin system
MVVSTAEAKNRLLDRMLMAQATVEGLVLVSGDAEIERHAPKGLRVIA